MGGLLDIYLGIGAYLDVYTKSTDSGVYEMKSVILYEDGILSGHPTVTCLCPTCLKR